MAVLTSVEGFLKMIFLAVIVILLVLLFSGVLIAMLSWLVLKWFIIAMVVVGAVLGNACFPGQVGAALGGLAGGISGVALLMFLGREKR